MGRKCSQKLCCELVDGFRNGLLYGILKREAVLAKPFPFLHTDIRRVGGRQSSTSVRGDTSAVRTCLAILPD